MCEGKKSNTCIGIQNYLQQVNMSCQIKKHQISGTFGAISQLKKQKQVANACVFGFLIRDNVSMEQILI